MRIITNPAAGVIVAMSPHDHTDEEGNLLDPETLRIAEVDGGAYPQALRVNPDGSATEDPEVVTAILLDLLVGWAAGRIGRAIPAGKDPVYRVRLEEALAFQRDGIAGPVLAEAAGLFGETPAARAAKIIAAAAAAEDAIRNTARASDRIKAAILSATTPAQKRAAFDDAMAAEAETT